MTHGFYRANQITILLIENMAVLSHVMMIWPLGRVPVEGVSLHVINSLRPARATLERENPSRVWFDPPGCNWMYSCTLKPKPFM